MGSDYITIFLNSAIAAGDSTGVMTLFFLFLARILPIIALAPFFGARVLPHPVKVCFAISLFVIFLPELLTVTTKPLSFNVTALVYMVKEFFVGLSIGYMISIPFIIVQSTGIIIDHQRGGASLMVNDPTIQNQSSPLGTFFNFVLIFIFFRMEGPFLFIDALVTSYEIIPPDKFFNPNFFTRNSGFWEMQIKLFNKLMVLSIQLATPALLAILMTDVFLGIANRLAPQVQITFLGMPLKSLLALGIIFFGWRIFTEELDKQCYEWLNTVKYMITLFKPP